MNYFWNVSLNQLTLTKSLVTEKNLNSLKWNATGFEFPKIRVGMQASKSIKKKLLRYFRAIICIFFSHLVL
jgi:hypothetical protein